MGVLPEPVEGSMEEAGVTKPKKVSKIKISKVQLATASN